MSEPFHTTGDAAPACVLVVDDYADACTAMERMISRNGYPATCALSGPAALRVLRERPCGLVLLDLMMPGMSGIEVMRIMAADPALRSVPVVICSAAERDTYWDELRGLGARDFLIKADTHFIRRLHEILQRHLGPPQTTTCA